MMLLVSGGNANPRWSHKTAYGKGRVDDDDAPSLYAQYVAMWNSYQQSRKRDLQNINESHG